MTDLLVDDYIVINDLNLINSKTNVSTDFVLLIYLAFVWVWRINEQFWSIFGKLNKVDVIIQIFLAVQPHE